MNAREREINRGFTWSPGDRYSLAECNQTQHAKRMAACLEAGPYHHLPEWVRAMFYERIDKWFGMIGVPVVPCPHEPYTSCEEMQKDVQDQHRLLVRFHEKGHLGMRTVRFRALHDYFGHVMTGAEFSLSGELRAYAKHTTQFPRFAWPYIWSNVCLENAFRLNRGHFFCFNNAPHCPAIVTFDAEEFGPEALFYGLDKMEAG